jgi:TatD DNase family protein
MRGKLRGVVHCFSGDRAMAKECLDLGFFISVPGTVTFKKAEILREVVKYTPLSSLLVETDAPYLAPIPYRGKRNEPAYVGHTAAKVAEIRGISRQETECATSENAKVLFAFATVPYDTQKDKCT